MAWFNNTEKNCNADVVLSSRVRLARNIEGYPFEPRLGDKSAAELIEKAGSLLEKNGFLAIDFTKLSPDEAISYVEKRYVSPEFAKKKSPHTLMLNEACGLAVMLCEEDHIRIQSIVSGLALSEAFSSACEVDNVISRELNIAYDNELGYLTHCPTNLGTGMRASVMMFLPALTMSGKIDSLAGRLSKIGLMLRGSCGEGSNAQGSLYQISNQITLGVTEEASIKKLEETIKQIADSERELRRLITEEKNPLIVDRICRAEGTLRHAFMLSSSEFVSLYSDIRLGIAIGIIKEVTYSDIDTLFVTSMPATLSLSAEQCPKNERERDILRAKRIRDALNS